MSSGCVYTHSPERMGVPYPVFSFRGITIFISAWALTLSVHTVMGNARALDGGTDNNGSTSFLCLRQNSGSHKDVISEAPWSRVKYE